MDAIQFELLVAVAVAAAAVLAFGLGYIGGYLQ